MNELVKHIEVLLLENDCVIIPDFGGFISHYSSASRVEEEELFLPPIRTVGFNQQLKINDGLLIQSFMKAYDTDFADAFKRVDKEVERLRILLRENGQVEFHGIGTITSGINNSYEFRPNETGLITPGLYGLSSFTINTLENTTKRTDEKNITHHHSKEVYEIKINRTLIRYAATAAAAIIAFFFLSVPADNTYVEEENYATLDAGKIFESIPYRSLAICDWPTSTESTRTQRQKVVTYQKSSAPMSGKSLKPVSVRTEKVSPRKTKSDETTINSNPAKPEAPVKPNIKFKETPSLSKSQKYNVIVASMGNKPDAEKMVARLKAKGYSSAGILEGNGKIRVSLISFPSQPEAYKKISRLKEEGQFKDAWVLTVN